MNEKLAKFARQNVVPGNSRGRGRYTSNALVSVGKTDESKGRHVIRFSLHKRAVDQLAWQVGDLISLNITDEGAIVLQRDNEHGMTLCKATGKKGRKYVRFSVIPEFFAVVPNGDGNEVEISNGRIAFCLGNETKGDR